MRPYRKVVTMKKFFNEVLDASAFWILGVGFAIEDKLKKKSK
jgi:hypothetical protein